MKEKQKYIVTKQTNGVVLYLTDIIIESWSENIKDAMEFDSKKNVNMVISYLRDSINYQDE